MTERRQCWIVVAAVAAALFVLPASAPAAKTKRTCRAAEAAQHQHQRGACRLRSVARVRGGAQLRVRARTAEPRGPRGVDREHLAPLGIQAYGPATLGRDGLVL
jgi:hypothetical protein